MQVQSLFRSWMQKKKKKLVNAIYVTSKRKEQSDPGADLCIGQGVLSHPMILKFLIMYINTLIKLLSFFNFYII